jgi:hypothetical protein
MYMGSMADITERKQVARNLAKAANKKPSAFFKLINEHFEEAERA